MADITLHVVEQPPIKLKYVEAAIKPEQTKDVVPSYEAQTVLPDDGMTLGRVNVSAIPDPTDEINITANGDYNVARIGVAHVDVQPTLGSETVTPTEQTQTVTPGQGYDGLSEVVVEPIPSEYVVPSGSVEITQNGETTVAGKATAIVNVPGIVPSGTKQISITQNGTTTHDVTQYASAEIVTNVNTDPEKGLVFGDYDSDGYPHSARFVGTWTGIPNNFLANALLNNNLFKNISSLNFPEGITNIGNKAFYSCYVQSYNFPDTLLSVGSETFSYTHADSITFPANCAIYGSQALRYSTTKYLTFSGNVTSIGDNFCRNNSSLLSVVFNGNVSSVPGGFSNQASGAILYDFSHCTAIPPLYSVETLGHAPGCVIRIPAALSDTTLGVGNGWESATNWSALTNIVWEVV